MSRCSPPPRRTRPAPPSLCRCCPSCTDSLSRASLQLAQPRGSGLPPRVSQALIHAPPLATAKKHLYIPLDGKPLLLRLLAGVCHGAAPASNIPIHCTSSRHPTGLLPVRQGGRATACTLDDAAAGSHPLPGRPPARPPAHLRLPQRSGSLSPAPCPAPSQPPHRADGTSMRHPGVAAADAADAAAAAAAAAAADALRREAA
eukprot:scaffold3347_cov382-Prasinococcus_capsulatus_cf.AAC.6